MDTQQQPQLNDLLDPTPRQREPQPGQIGVVRAFAEPDSIDEERQTMRFACSTRNLARYSEIVEPKAFEKWLPTFMANPVFVAGHVYIGMSGEPTTIGHWLDMQVTDEGLEGTAQCLDNDELAGKYWNRYRKGVQKAVSVGWITHAHEMEEQEIDGVTQRVRVFYETEFLEVSATAIPANRESVVRLGRRTPHPPRTPTRKTAANLRYPKASRRPFKRPLNTRYTNALMPALAPPWLRSSSRS